MVSKVLHVGRAEWVDRPNCEHRDVRSWTVGNEYYFVRCEACGMSSGNYGTAEQAIAEGRGNLVRILHPGL